jgi:hypothetical protein
MTQNRRGKLANDMAHEWLARHAPKQTPKPKPQQREQWQVRRQQQQQERRALAKPLLKGVE